MRAKCEREVRAQQCEGTTGSRTGPLSVYDFLTNFC